MSKTRTRHYTPGEIIILLIFIPLLFFARGQIYFQSSEKILRFLNRRRGTGKTKISFLTRFSIPRLYQLLETADRHTSQKPSCLRQALVLTWLFRLFGLDSDIQIGVRQNAGTFEAHTWLEYRGIPLQTISPSLYHPLSKQRKS